MFPLGVALLLAALFSQGGTAFSATQQITPTPTLSAMQRLAEPTLPVSPGQADYGSQVYWLWCLPCHGDRGQGLTDEFRQTYPPEEQYCWEGGCHGDRPYESGFRLPGLVPAVIGDKADLRKFVNAAGLKAYIKSAMPYWKPGALSDDEAWNVTAFLIRENRLWQGNFILDDATAQQVILQSIAPTPLATPLDRKGQQPAIFPWLLLLALLVLAGYFFFRYLFRNQPERE